MKKLALAALLLAGLAAPVLADPVEGTWQTKPDDNGNFGYIQIVPCGAKYCGTLIKSFGPDGKVLDSPNTGKRIVWDMVAQGNGAYGDGKIWSPDRDKTYSSKMQLTGNKLAVSGCVLGGLICRNGGNWTRVK
ncbi:DUF2147 domain-containing protein [Acidimangrovimonas pyrenivorans]|uniref:DUF2147 domain-containing protein n=1 Tax=Acidimangrovimonas pyrenivorans TaxID=2030798 RepID=A0ABV7AI19_9RHOB